LIGARPGCPFHERCAYEPLTEGKAATIVPALRESARAGHFVACHLSDQVRDEIFAREIAPAL
jgi:peptide/nickel transport system ATP-binding protein